VCTHCNQTYSLEKSLARHIKTEHNKGYNFGPFPCKDCDKVYNSPKGLREHRRLKHPDNGQRWGPFECELCGKVYEWPGSLREHRRLKHPESLLEDASREHDTTEAPESWTVGTSPAKGSSNSNADMQIEGSSDQSPSAADEEKNNDSALMSTRPAAKDPNQQAVTLPRKRSHDEAEQNTAESSEDQNKELQKRKKQIDDLKAVNSKLQEERDSLKTRLKLQKGEVEAELEELKIRCEALENERDSIKARLESVKAGSAKAQDERVTLAYGYLCEATARVESAREMILKFGEGL
jgi:hypothetical protein